MGDSPKLADEQLATLARLTALPAVRGFYLAGGTAVAAHVGHRASRDLDLFSIAADADLELVRAALVASLPDVEVVAITDVALHVRSSHTPIDVVRYAYPPLEPPTPGPGGFPLASIPDLATMKLAAVARRGIRRDFWDLHAMFDANRLTLATALDAYTRRYGVTQSGAYHVLRALVYFDDAELEATSPAGLSSDKWNMIKAWFRAHAPDELRRRAGA